MFIFTLHWKSCCYCNFPPNNISQFCVSINVGLIFFFFFFFFCNPDACSLGFPPQCFRLLLSYTDPSPGGYSHPRLCDRQTETESEPCLDSKHTGCTENTQNRGAELREHLCLYFPRHLLNSGHASMWDCVCACVCAVIVVNGLITDNPGDLPPGLPFRCVFACVRVL